MKNIQLLFISFIVFSGCNKSKEEAIQASQIDLKIETIGPKNGSLLIIGGGSDPLYAEFMKLAGGPDSPIVVIPTALSSDTLTEEFLVGYKKQFLNEGFTKITVLHTRNPEVANTQEFIEPILNAKGVWFSGGRQWRHADSYLNTKAHEAFKNLLDRGGVIAGSSAGATIQGSYLARGDTKKNTIMMGDHEEGLGFLSNVSIDQHLFTRNRQFDMFEILDSRPELLGIGLDENTGIIVQGDEFRVVGKSYVAIYDGTRWSQERDTIYQLPEGSREYYLLKAGNEYNLRKRKVITFDDREFIQLQEVQAQKYSGVYQLVDNSLRVEILIENDSVNMHQIWNGSKYPIIPESVTRLFIIDSELYLEFDINESGDINSFTFSDDGSIWQKIKN